MSASNFDPLVPPMSCNSAAKQSALSSSEVKPKRLPMRPAKCITPSECSKRECLAPGYTNDASANCLMDRRR